MSTTGMRSEINHPNLDLKKYQYMKISNMHFTSDPKSSRTSPNKSGTERTSSSQSTLTTRTSQRIPSEHRSREEEYQAQMTGSDAITQAQLSSLDDTDCYASVWEQILEKQRDGETSQSGLWGGRGKGGRGLARRTIQPRDIVVEDVRLQYLLGDTCLEGATIKLLHNHVYCLVGRNGCGKSTLLKKMHSQRIPGWSIQWSTLYIPPNIPLEYLSLTPTEVVSKYIEECKRDSRLATESQISELEDRMDNLDIEQEQEEMELLCEELSALEDNLNFEDASLKQEQIDLFREFGIDSQKACEALPPIQQKEILLCAAFICCRFTNLLLLDEPTNDLDVHGLIRLRQLINDDFVQSTTVLMVSHDVDLINDVATDIIDMCARNLWYYPGNYDSYRLMKDQKEAHFLKQSHVMQKKNGQLLATLQHLKEKPAAPKRRGGAKKKAKAIASHRKKIDRHQKSMKTLDSSAEVPTEREGLSVARRLKLAEILKNAPDKAVQFALPKVTSQWGEPLVVAYDVGYGPKDDIEKAEAQSSQIPSTDFVIVKRDGFLFDCVDICIEEGSQNCILGPGISTLCLMKILAKKLAPVEGTVHHSSGLGLGYLGGREIAEIVAGAGQTTTALEFLSQHSEKLEKDLRSHLTAFGLSPQSQTVTPLACLSGGETFRFALSKIFLENPSVLFLEHPTSHLDVESVQALSHGLREWNGTLIMVCQDASFLRSLEGVRCVVIVPEEGKVRRIVDDDRGGMQGMDAYLNSLQKS